jgi:hypothetical protein
MYQYFSLDSLHLQSRLALKNWPRWNIDFLFQLWLPKYVLIIGFAWLRVRSLRNQPTQTQTQYYLRLCAPSPPPKFTDAEREEYILINILLWHTERISQRGANVILLHGKSELLHVGLCVC